MSIALLFYVVAAILFAVAALGVNTDRFNLVAAGLAFFALAHVVG